MLRRFRSRINEPLIRREGKRGPSAVPSHTREEAACMVAFPQFVPLVFGFFLSRMTAHLSFIDLTFSSFGTKPV